MLAGSTDHGRASFGGSARLSRASVSREGTQSRAARASSPPGMKTSRPAQSSSWDALCLSAPPFGERPSKTAPGTVPDQRTAVIASPERHRKSASGSIRSKPPWWT